MPLWPPFFPFRFGRFFLVFFDGKMDVAAISGSNSGYMDVAGAWRTSRVVLALAMSILAPTRRWLQKMGLVLTLAPKGRHPFPAEGVRD